MADCRSPLAIREVILAQGLDRRAEAGLHDLRHPGRGQAEMIAEEHLLTELDMRIRGVSEGPDGALYVLTDRAEGKILKLVARK